MSKFACCHYVLLQFWIDFIWLRLYFYVFVGEVNKIFSIDHGQSAYVAGQVRACPPSQAAFAPSGAATLAGRRLLAAAVAYELAGAGHSQPSAAGLGSREAAGGRLKARRTSTTRLRLSYAAR